MTGGSKYHYAPDRTPHPEPLSTLLHIYYWQPSQQKTFFSDKITCDMTVVDTLLLLPAIKDYQCAYYVNCSHSRMRITLIYIYDYGLGEQNGQHLDLDKLVTKLHSFYFD